MQGHQLNAQNPEFLLYKYEALEFAVLGGIKLDTLNSMRATIKRGNANDDAFKVCASTGLSPRVGRYLISALRAWKSVQLLHEETS